MSDDTISYPLMPCPFCGSDEIEVSFVEDDFLQTMCKTCCAIGPEASKEVEAIAKWNYRCVNTKGHEGFGSNG